MAGLVQGEVPRRLADVRVEDAKLALLKPETYMNESGASIQAAAAFYKLAPEQVLVVHDDVDLETARPPGAPRRRARGPQRPALDRQRLGSQDFLRLRVGVGRPGRATRARSPTTCCRRSRPRTTPRRSWPGGDAVEALVARGLEETQRRFN